MQKIIIRTGLISLAVMLLLFVITLMIGKQIDFSVQEIIGYVGIIVPLLFVYFGIRQYRDKVNGGRLSFGEGMKVGLLIVLIPSILFGISDVVYSTYINPNFYEEYCNAMLQKMKATLPPSEYAIRSKEIIDSKAMFADNPGFQFALMAMTVFVFGLIITIISSLILRKNKAV